MPPTAGIPEPRDFPGPSMTRPLAGHQAIRIGVRPTGGSHHLPNQTREARLHPILEVPASAITFDSDSGLPIHGAGSPPLGFQFAGVEDASSPDDILDGRQHRDHSGPCCRMPVASIDAGIDASLDDDLTRLAIEPGTEVVIRDARDQKSTLSGRSHAA